MICPVGKVGIEKSREGRVDARVEAEIAGEREKEEEGIVGVCAAVVLGVVMESVDLGVGTTGAIKSLAKLYNKGIHYLRTC